MALLDLLGRRWTLRVLWELRERPLSFRALRAQCDELSPTILNRRLAELREAAIVVLGDDGYGLSEDGSQLVEALLPLHQWAEGWAKRIR